MIKYDTHSQLLKPCRLQSACSCARIDPFLQLVVILYTQPVSCVASSYHIFLLHRAQVTLRMTSIYCHFKMSCCKLFQIHSISSNTKEKSSRTPGICHLAWLEVSLTWPECFLGAGNYHLQYKHPVQIEWVWNSLQLFLVLK